MGKNNVKILPKFIDVNISVLDTDLKLMFDEVITGLNNATLPFIDFLETCFATVECPYGFDRTYGKRLFAEFIKFSEERYPETHAMVQKYPDIFYKSYIRDILKILNDKSSKYLVAKEIAMKFKATKKYKINRFFFGFTNNINYIDFSDIKRVEIPGVGQVGIDIERDQEDIRKWKVNWGYIVKDSNHSPSGWKLTLAAIVPPPTKKQLERSTVGVGVLVSRRGAMIYTINSMGERDSYYVDPIYDEKYMSKKFSKLLLEAVESTNKFIKKAAPRFVIVEYDDGPKVEMDKVDYDIYDAFYKSISRLGNKNTFQFLKPPADIYHNCRCIDCGCVVPELKNGRQLGTCPNCQAKSFSSENRIVNLIREQFDIIKHEYSTEKVDILEM